MNIYVQFTRWQTGLFEIFDCVVLSDIFFLPEVKVLLLKLNDGQSISAFFVVQVVDLIFGTIESEKAYAFSIMICSFLLFAWAKMQRIKESVSRWETVQAIEQNKKYAEYIRFHTAGNHYFKINIIILFILWGQFPS